MTRERIFSLLEELSNKKKKGSKVKILFNRDNYVDVETLAEKYGLKFHCKSAKTYIFEKM